MAFARFALAPAVVQVDELLRLREVQHDVELGDGLLPRGAKSQPLVFVSLAFQRIFRPAALRVQEFMGVTVFNQDVHKMGLFSVPAVLDKYHRHAKIADDQAGKNGPEKNDGFAALFPQRLPVKKILPNRLIGEYSGLMLPA